MANFLDGYDGPIPFATLVRYGLWIPSGEQWKPPHAALNKKEYIRYLMLLYYVYE